MSNLPSDPVSRPRPVLLYGMVNTAVLAFLGGAGAVDLIPAKAVAVVALAWAVVGGAWAFYVQSVTTPVSAPRDARGMPLVPLDRADEPPAAPPAMPTTTGKPTLPE